MTCNKMHALIIAIFLLAIQYKAEATTYTVCASGCNYTTIQAAINNASTVSGDIIQINDATFTDLSVTVNKSGLTIQGQGQTTTTLQAGASQGAASDRIFTVNASISVTFKDMTIRYGNASGRGGAILMNDMCSITMNRVTLTNNDSGQDGGAIASAGSTSGITLIMTDCVVSYNNGGLNDMSADGGGIYQGGGNLSMTDCSVVNNKAGDDGGGIYLNEYGSSNSFTNCTISNNTCGVAGAAANTLDGGGLLNEDGITTLINCTIAGNTSPGYAGGIGVPFGSIHMTNNIFADNSAGINANDVCLSSGVVGTNNNNLAESCHGPGCPTWTSTVDPGLSSLSICLGGTQYAYSYTTGSSAENAGTNTGAPSTDICGTTRSNPPDLGSFEIGSSLPIELTRFTGSWKQENILLNWETQMELNNEYFSIERSYNGVYFDQIGLVNGAGSYTGTLKYSYLDNDFDNNESQIYYRIKQYDYDGLYSFSNTIIFIVDREQSFGINYIYADQDKASITYEHSKESEVVANLYDLNGRLMISQNYQSLEGTNQIELNIQNLPGGMYVLRLGNNQGYISEKIMKP